MYLQWVHPETPVAEITGFDLKPNTNNLTVGGTRQLTHTVEPEAYSEPVTLSYLSEDDSIVTVDSDGNVTATGEGTATVTATVDGTDFSDTVTINVTVPDGT